MGKLKIGFIGYGNMGGQLANAAVAAGIPAMAVNTSVQDFDTLAEEVSPFLIGDGYGSGKNRDTAKGFLADSLSIVNDDVFKGFIIDKDIIFHGGSAGGGTGSGILPSMVNIIETHFAGKCNIVITTFPSLSEKYRTQNNTECFMRELLNNVEVPYIMYDNDKFAHMDVLDMNKAIINKAVLDMQIIRGDFTVQTTSGGIDERDMMVVCSKPGRMVCEVVDNLDESMITNGSIIATLNAAIVDSANATVVIDKKIQGSALMYNLPSSLKKYSVNCKVELEDTFGIIEDDVYNEAIDVKAEHESFVACILSGLTEPTTRIDQTIARRKKLEADSEATQASTTKLNTVEAGRSQAPVKSFSSQTKVDASKMNIDTSSIKLL